MNSLLDADGCTLELSLLSGSTTASMLHPSAFPKMDKSMKMLVGWAFCMVTFPLIPLSTVFIIQPTLFHMLVYLILIGAVSAVVGRMFDD